LISFGEQAIRRGGDVLSRIDVVRINDRVLRAAAVLMPTELRSLDAIHLVTAQLFRSELQLIITHDNRMVSPAEALGWRVEQPG
jgi:predicted nucleic acid-binding protein